MSESPAPERPLDQRVFDEWPETVRAWFDGSSLASKTGFTASLLTVDANGHVRTSLLGVGELYARCVSRCGRKQGRRARLRNTDGPRSALFATTRSIRFSCSSRRWQRRLATIAVWSI
jgi:hypothetical protein